MNNRTIGTKIRKAAAQLTALGEMLEVSPGMQPIPPPPPVGEIYIVPTPDPPIGEWVMVKSSAIRRVMWERQDNTPYNTYHAGILTVDFADGAMYQYRSIDRTQFRSLVTAASVGAHFNKYIKAAHTPSRRISEPWSRKV